MVITNRFRLMLNQLLTNPKIIFLIDGLGAFLTALLLGTVLIRLEEVFGMPAKVLTPLSILAFIYAIYSMSCHFFVGGDWRPFLRVIAIANLIYCCITLGLIVLFYRTLTILGLTYFFGEIIIMGGLVFIEVLAIAKSNDMHINKNNR